LASRLRKNIRLAT